MLFLSIRVDYIIKRLYFGIPALREVYPTRDRDSEKGYGN